LVLRYEGFALLSVAHAKQIGDLMQPFSPIPTSVPGVGYRLSVANFPDGAQAYLDSRGLLHLKASDRQSPEATFIIADEDAAGWSSDGRMWGTSYFLGSRPAVKADEIHQSILIPFTRGFL